MQLIDVNILVQAHREDADNHAALALEYGCVWISLDRGFRRYPGLKLRHPLE